MSLAIGSRLGPYEIVALIGAGGMGEVYRATDTNLARQVAIKVLPEAVASDAERLARFAREARTLAALNHPNIAAIYGLERTGGTTALVMELVEGPTLADRIVQGPLPVEEALPIAKQIADALAAAHEQGIIHRDLKPANIKLRPDGAVKVLDFGLAKALEPVAPPGAAATMSPTLSVHATQAGIILGTAAYMSPEQARGKPVDARADIWAYGIVLFEMLAGRRPFEGDEISDVIASVLKSEPAWHLLPRETPATVHRLLRRCLQKDRQQRLQHIGDARIEIEEAQQAPTTFETSPLPRRAHRERVAWGAALLVAAIAATIGWWTRSAPDAPEMRVEINAPGIQTFSLSPDGRKIVYSADTDTGRQLWIRFLDQVAPQPLRGTEGGFAAFWSPDSRSIAFFTNNSLKRLDLESGESAVLASVITPAGGTWGPDGTILYVPNDNSGIFRVAASGGTSTGVTPNRTPGLATRLPQFLPDGRHFIFYVARGGDPAGVYVGEVGSDVIRRLLRADAPARFGSGHLWFVRDTTLFAQQFDPSTQQLIGPIMRVADDVAVTLTAAAVSVSNAGSVGYRTAVGLATPSRLTWFDRTGNQLGTAGEANMAYPSLSADGRRVAVQKNTQQNIDVWIVELDRNASTRQTANPGIDAMPVWSPVGNRFVFKRSDGGSDFRRVFLKNIETGHDEEIPIPPGPGVVIPSDVSSDGRLLLYKDFNEATGGSTDLWVIQIDGRSAPVSVAQSPHNERDGQFSPDGNWIAFESDETDRPEIYVQPFPGPGAKIAVSTGGGRQVRWRGDGQELFYIAADNTLMSVPIRDALLPSGLGTPVPLFKTRIVPLSAIARQQYVATSDGKRFLIDTQDEASAAPITLILNWKPPSARER